MNVEDRIEKRALIGETKPDVRKGCGGLHVAIYEVHGLTTDEIAALDRFMASMTFTDFETSIRGAK